jgi:cell division protein FtsB
MAKNCVRGSVGCKNIKCSEECATCNVVPDKIKEIKSKIESCETLLASLQKTTTLSTQTLSSLQLKKRILDAQIVQVERSTQVKALSTQPPIKTTTDMIKELKAENNQMKAVVTKLSTRLASLKSQLTDSTKMFDDNQKRLNAAKDCFAAIKEIEEKRKVVSTLKSELKGIKAKLGAMVSEEQKTSGLPVDFNDEKCQTRYRLAVEKHNLALNERNGLKTKLGLVQKQFITKGNEPFVQANYYCDGSSINYLKELKEFYGVVLNTPTSADSSYDGYKNGSNTCQSWQGINTKEVQSSVLGVPEDFGVYPGENCWNPIVRRCVNLNNNTPSGGSMPANVKSIVQRLNLTSEEKALISERISLGKEAFMKKYNVTQAVSSNENCPDGWTQMTHPSSGKAICVDKNSKNPVGNTDCANSTVSIDGQTYTFANFDNYSKDQKKNWAANVCQLRWRAVGA